MRRTGYRLVPCALVLGVVLIVSVACSGPAAFHGTALEPDDVAPGFRLRDQFGGTVQLSESAGKVVVLTFLYTSCPDVCPITTETLRRTHNLLGEDAGLVDFLAITVDPERDSVDRAYQYSLEKDMQDKWSFLVGTEEELVPVWRAYWLDPVRGESGGSDGLRDGDHGERPGGAKQNAHDTDSAARTLSGGYLISHTAPVYLIDRRGYRRVIFTDLSLDPGALVHDIRLLIK